MHVARRVGLLGVLIVAAAAGPSVATASVVAVDTSFVRYVAGAGEGNQVSITPADGTTMHIVDLGATIEVGHGCQQVDLHAVRCTGERGGSLHNIEVDAGDMNDAVTLSVPSGVAGLLGEDLTLNADGGAGDDVLRVAEDALDERPRAIGVLNGGIGDDRLWGGAGNDGLDGGGGRDELYGGRGNDRLTDGDRDGAVDETAPGPDILDGGSGGEDIWQNFSPAGDVVSYSERTSSVSIDLRAEAPGGEQGEGDRIAGMEGAEGGKANDTLHGGDVAGRLHGGPGDDVIAGGAGDEQVTGDAGNDRLTGDAGSDWVQGGDGDDRVLGGRGNDQVWGDRGRDRLSGDTGRDGVYGHQGDDRLLGGPGHDRMSGGPGEDVLKCGSDTDDMVAPERDLMRASCERVVFYKAANDEYESSIGMTVAAHPLWRPWPWLALRLACPWHQIVEEGGPRRRVSPAGGELKIRARSGRRVLLARARIPDESPTCAPARGLDGLWARAPLTELGRRLAGREDGVLATVWLRVRVIAPGAYQTARFRAVWTIHLRAPSRAAR